MYNLAYLKKHMVDLRRSDIDKERTIPKDGKYFFKGDKKVYLSFDDYKDSSTRPNFAYRWVAYDSRDDFRSMQEWSMKYQAEPVRYDDPLTEVWPEPLVPNAEGHYRYMDMILMRIPVDVWVDKLAEDQAFYKNARKALDKKFQNECKQEGADYEVVKSDLV